VNAAAECEYEKIWTCSKVGRRRGVNSEISIKQNMIVKRAEKSCKESQAPLEWERNQSRLGKVAVIRLVGVAKLHLDFFF
jgi:hypothetical protein